jgi:signal transduction histidine kinase
LGTQSKKQNTERVDFVAAITHELKTSLTAIIASVEILAEELQLDDQSVHWKLIQSIIRNAHRLNERVSFFAEMPRPPMENFQFQPEPVNIGQIVNSVATRLHPRIQSKRQAFIVDLPESLPLARADKQHLEQIMLMLIANASNYSTEEGKIRISAWKNSKDNIVIQVNDTCGGIPTEEEERIFLPHYQIKRTDGKGGLGLAITKFLVELHGGKIWLKSKDGQGCSFFFSLPIAEEVS